MITRIGSDAIASGTEGLTMIYTRRDIGKLALATMPVAGLMAAEKPNSKFGGVQIGAITYSFRALPASAEETLKYLLETGLSACEMMGPVAESYAGVPSAGGGGGAGRAAGGGAGRAAGAPQANTAGAGGGQGRGRAAMTPEQQEARRRAADDIKNWRLSASMDKYKALRKMYNDAGVTIYAYKLEPQENMSDEEFEYIFNVANALGATHVTRELPTNEEFARRIGDLAAKHKLMMGYHNHTQVKFNSWDNVIANSKGNGLNLDVGHYYAANGESAWPLIQKYHDRVASLHLKDRRGPTNGGANMPWGQGETPLKEILLGLKQEKYKIPGSIELEYDVPENSSVLVEVSKCVQYCKDVLA